MFLRYSHPFSSQQWPGILSSTPRKRFEKAFRDRITFPAGGSLTSTGGSIHEVFMEQPRTELTPRNIACIGPSGLPPSLPVAHTRSCLRFWDIRGTRSRVTFVPVILLHENHNQRTPRTGERGSYRPPVVVYLQTAIFRPW